MFPAFDGFSPKTLEFLRDIRFNNSKAWYEENKENYREYVLKPFQALVSELGIFMLSIDPQFELTPAVDKTISRIYRDTRFSKDKSLYRDTAWITFRRMGRDWKADPCYFFEISPDWYRYGMGFYTATKEAMDRLREIIDEEPDEFGELLSIYSSQKLFTLEGDKYRRVLNERLTEEESDWYQRKNLYLMCTKKADNLLFSKELAGELISGFALLKPLYDFLWKVKMEGERKL